MPIRGKQKIERRKVPVNWASRPHWRPRPVPYEAEPPGARGFNGSGSASE